MKDGTLWGFWLVCGLLGLGVGGCMAPPLRAQVGLEAAFPQLQFNNPVDLQHAGDAGRLFVVEQAGRVQVFANDPATATAEVFLDLTDRVQSGGERGLLGLAFHPQYADNGFFFVYYTAPNPLRTVVSRFSVSATDPDRADAGSEEVLLEVNQPFSNHNGGQLRFGPEGYLYIALGDGGSGGDPQGHGQNRTTLLGALLRIDVDHADDGRPYAIPADNPLVGCADGCREEIYAYGLRNPWRFSFDAPTGRLWLADVGQNAFEEINVIEAGGNYGWKVMEGLHCFSPSSGCDETGLALPVWEYGHSLGSSVTGGLVYRGSSVPDLVGRYVYADFVSGRVWALTYEGQSVTENTQLIDTDLSISAFGTDANDELYFVTLGGTVYRFTPSTDLGSASEGPDPSFQLGAGFPNPFRTQTTVPLTLARAAHIVLSVYDLLGRRVRVLAEGTLPPGHHALPWDGLDANGGPLPPGVYVAHLAVAGHPTSTRELVRIR